MSWDRLYQHINISGNARVHLGDNANRDQRANDLASRTQALLEWLHYPRMTSRKESLKDTHADTFQWILRNENLEGRPDPGFRTWLEHGSGIYWIAGKAGSGKSTLMKLITDHHETQRALRIWAGDTILVCPSFYFWYGGTQTQRSRIGMLRSLLHELLLTNEDLVPTAFPLWTERDSVLEPEFPELRAALGRTLAADERKICFFIDGLDEYEGDSIRTAALADYLEKLTKPSANVKIVVSSRPLHELQVHIEAWPYLMLQDLTSKDIATFVEDRLRKNGQMLRLESQEPTATAELVGELVSRASGVFLWVYVVVQSLLDGLKSRDKVVDLMDRVLELPTELNELFSVMLGRINPRYRAQAYRLLYVTYRLLPHVQDPRSAGGVHALVLSYAEQSGRMTRSLQRYRNTSSAELEDRQQEINIVVRSRCLGLLEVSSEGYSTSNSHVVAIQFQGLATNYWINYIHRSVAEYLDGIGIHARVAETSELDFDVNVAILNALAITCRHGVYFRILEVFSHFNRQAEQSTKKAQSTAVDELDYHLSDLQHAPVKDDAASFFPWTTSIPAVEGKHWANRVIEENTRPCPWHDTILAFAIRCGWELYVVEKLSEHGNGLPAKQGRPLLDYAVHPEPVASLYVYGMSPNIVRCLLDHGADPNAKFDGYSAWSNTLRYIAKYGFGIWLRQHDIATHALQVVEVMKLLLAYGAAKTEFCVLESVRDGLQEVLAIIEDNKGDRGKMEKPSTIDDEEEQQVAPVSFAGSSRSEPHNTFLSQKSSLSQRIKAKLLKRIR